MNHLLPMVCVAATAFAGTSLADPSPFCGKSGASDRAEVREAFAGDWTIEHQSGYALMGQMVCPFPATGRWRP